MFPAPTCPAAPDRLHLALVVALTFAPCTCGRTDLCTLHFGVLVLSNGANAHLLHMVVGIICTQRSWCSSPWLR